jgi:hypothetical protein
MRRRALVLQQSGEPLRLGEFDVPAAEGGGLVAGRNYGTDLHLQRNLRETSQ